jgi:hypothetical protein
VVLWATVGVGAGFAAHGFMSLGKRWWQAEQHPAAREKAAEAQRKAQDDQKGGQQ